MTVDELLKRAISDWTLCYPFIWDNECVHLDADTKSVEVREQLERAALALRSGKFLVVSLTCPRAPQGLTKEQEEEFSDKIIDYCLDQKGWWGIASQDNPDYDGTSLAVWFRERED